MYRILVIVIVAAAMYAAWERYRDGRFSPRKLVFWWVIWAVVLLFGLIPQLSTSITRLVGIGRGADLFFFFSIIAMMYLLFLMHGRLQRLQQEITEMARQQALREAGLGDPPEDDKETNPE